MLTVMTVTLTQTGPNLSTNKWDRAFNSLCNNLIFKWCNGSKGAYFVNLCFPGGSEVKNLPANAGDSGLIHGSGRFPWKRKWQPTPVFLPGKSHGQRSLVGYSPWSCKESYTTTSFCMPVMFQLKSTRRGRKKIKKTHSGEKRKKTHSEMLNSIC